MIDHDTSMTTNRRRVYRTGFRPGAKPSTFPARRWPVRPEIAGQQERRAAATRLHGPDPIDSDHMDSSACRTGKRIGTVHTTGGKSMQMTSTRALALASGLLLAGFAALTAVPPA